MFTNAKGNLIIIGGAEDKEGEKNILKFVASKIRNQNELLLIVTIATEYPEEAARKYTNVFKNLGVNSIKTLDVSERSDCNKEENIKLINEAKVIFFTGGDQVRITSIIGGTPIYSEMGKMIKNGCYFVGTSAGASVMSDTMIVGGDDEESPKKCTLKMAPGLGFLENIIIDQHFAQRGRIGRLLVGVAQNPEILGIGIDEDTAIVVNNDILEVIGSGAVYIVDGSQISYSNVSEQYQDELLSMFNVKMHVLTFGKKFNIKTKVPFEEERAKNENH
ncbi:cyanophycinase [Clostridium cavendishii DSM 21758]|uniref:Cyanophycinase n=1 Tax=Clostridium cavendishii DSM 21758 TaxID=1121302 RepID=A0A1M6U6H6_9CLOT|nr:cyanophycinase [Clostridium cavendishii]SHK64773.1 cyanophycinase [Clostridium cavendishii DSM 21758]